MLSASERQNPLNARARLEKVAGGENLAPSLKDVFVPESL